MSEQRAVPLMAQWASSRTLPRQTPLTSDLGTRGENNWIETAGGRSVCISALHVDVT